VKRGNGGRKKRAAMKSLTRRWMDSNGQPVIPYRIEGSVGEGRNLFFKEGFIPGSTPKLVQLLALNFTTKLSHVNDSF